MAGKIKMMIDKVIQERSGGNKTIMETTRAKFMLKGINVDKYTSASEDDPVVIEKIKSIANDFKVKL